MNEVVAQKGRIPVDVSDLKEAIEKCRNDAAWTELPLSAKIRVLLRERLEQMAKEESKVFDDKDGRSP
jgi:hypothetical protein